MGCSTSVLDELDHKVNEGEKEREKTTKKKKPRVRLQNCLCGEAVEPQFSRVCLNIGNIECVMVANIIHLHQGK
jgi:hypothetical protein